MIREVRSVADAIHDAQETLDDFNLRIAKSRVAYGMSPDFIHLYRVMGDINKALEKCKVLALGAEQILTCISKRGRNDN